MTHFLVHYAPWLLVPVEVLAVLVLVLACAMIVRALFAMLDPNYMDPKGHR